MSIKELSLDEGERVEWHRCQCTFHRTYDWELAVTNKSACIYKPKFLRGLVWTKFPLETISSVDICTPGIISKFRTGWLAIILFLTFMFLFIVCLTQPFDSRTVFFLGFFFWIMHLIFLSVRGRTKIIIRRMKKRTYRYVSYPDTYSDEKEHDRHMLIEFAEHLSQKGIKTSVSVNISEKYQKEIQQYKSRRKQTGDNK